MVKIRIISDEQISKEYGLEVRSFITYQIKNLLRYGEVDVPQDVILKTLYLALKGYGCKEHHLDVAQKDSLYHYLKDKEIEDPYIQQFIKKVEKENNEIHI